MQWWILKKLKEGLNKAQKRYRQFVAASSWVILKTFLQLLPNDVIGLQENLK